MSGDDDRSRAVVDDDEEGQRLLARIDAEIAATLQVTPAPGFQARVRQRIEKRPPFRWRWQWWLMPAAAVAAAALLAVRRPLTAPVTLPSAPARAAARSGSPEVPVPPIFTPPTVTAPSPHHAPRRPAAEPEILVPPAERQALQRYLDELPSRVAALGVPPPDAFAAGGAPATDMPLNPISLLPTQTAVASIDPAPAPREIEIGPIRIALIGVEPLTMESRNEENK